MLRYLDENSEEHGRALLYALNLQSAIPRDLIPDFSSETDMRNGSSTEEKNIAVLAEQERGMGTTEVCRKYVISPATFLGTEGEVWRNGRL
jgi:hypothetical protein